MTATIQRPTDFQPGQPLYDTQPTPAGLDHTSDQTTELPAPSLASSGRTTLPHSNQSGCDTQCSVVAVGATLPDPARRPAIPKGNLPGQDQTVNGSATTIAQPIPIRATSLADPFLALAADVVDDAERTRIANENRLRQLTRSGEDSDGKERGFGLDVTHPDVARLAALVKLLADVEHQATLNLNRLLRQHPLGPWIKAKAQKGVGDKQAARLLAIIGDPYWHQAEDRPRLVSELWSYCGHGDPNRKLKKGMTQAELFTLGSPLAKMRVFLIATSCLKAGGHYADVYRDRRDQTEERTHARDCKRCGPSGHPALSGSPWSKAHQHADALRIVGKEFLRDLWAESKRLHETEKADPS